MDGSSYFWKAIFIAACHDMWGALYNLKDLISNITREIFPGSTAKKSSLKKLVYSKGNYRLEKNAVTVGDDESGPEKEDSSSLDPHQSKFDDLSKLKGSLRNLEELQLVLAEAALGQLTKTEHPNFLPNFVLMRPYQVYTLLCDAARHGHSGLIPKLEALFGNLKFKDDDEDDFSFMNLLNGDGPVPEWDVDDQPLDIAVRRGHYLIVEALLDAGADPNGAEIGDLLSVMVAAESGRDDMVRLLIKRGGGGSTPSYRVQVLRHLMDLGDRRIYTDWLKDVSEYDNLFSVLSYIGLFGAFEEYELLDIVSVRVQEQLKSPTHKTPRSGEPFLRSVFTELEREELQIFVDEDFLGEEDCTGRGLELILDVLTGVHVEQQARGILRTALFGSAEEMNEILDPPTISDSPSLHTLVSRNAPNALGVFLELGPNLAALDTNGNSALHVAATWNRHTCARQLLKFGIDINTENKDGKTAYQIAFENGCKEIGEEIALFSRGFNLDLLSPHESVPLIAFPH